MPGSAWHTTAASRHVALNTKFSQDQRDAIAELLAMLHTTFDDLPAEVQSVYSHAIAQLETT